MLPMMRMASGRQPLVNLTRSYSKQVLVQWTRSGLIFVLIFIKNSTRDRNYCSATFGRNISGEVKLSSADDMGVWFVGLNACNFRRILLKKKTTMAWESRTFRRNLTGLDFTGFQASDNLK